jgi:hypothetical protein
VKAWRIAFAVGGLLLGGFGVFRLLTEIPFPNLLALAVWLLAALVLHDGVVAPAVVGAGWGLRRLVPDRGRRFLQLGLTAAACVTVVAVPMIVLRGSQPAVKALLLRDYGAGLVIIYGVIAVACAAGYAAQVAQDRRPG